MKSNFALCLVLILLATSTAFSQLPAFSHVFIVVEENHNYSSVIGSSSMPYLNSLANKYGLATQYYANTHPSIGNYFELTAGQIITNNDSFNGTVSADNVVRHCSQPERHGRLTKTVCPRSDTFLPILATTFGVIAPCPTFPTW
jgi:hypothetical protein